MKKRIYLGFMVAALGVIAGCAGGALKINRYTPGSESTGIVYALPKTVVTVSIPFTVKTSRRLNSAGKYAPNSTAELGVVAVTTAVEPDMDNAFEIDTSVSDSMTWKNSFSATLNENMTLAKGNVTTEDVTLTAVKDVVSALASVATLFRAGSADAPQEVIDEVKALEELEKKTRSSLYALLDSVASTNPDTAALKRIEARRDLLQKTLELTKARLTELRIKNPHEFKLTVNCTVDLSTPTAPHPINKDNCPSLEAAYARFADLKIEDDLLPKSYVFELSQNPIPNAPYQSTAANAYVYRIPWIGSYAVRDEAAGVRMLAQGPITIAQLGSFGHIHVKKARFAKHVADLELHAGTGGLKMYKSTRESAGLSSAATGIESIADAIEEAKKEPTELETLEAQNKLLEAQKKQIELERGLAELLEEEMSE